jgi:hypothetical protein
MCLRFTIFIIIIVTRHVQPKPCCCSLIKHAEMSVVTAQLCEMLLNYACNATVVHPALHTSIYNCESLF